MSEVSELLMESVLVGEGAAVYGMTNALDRQWLRMGAWSQPEPADDVVA